MNDNINKVLDRIRGLAEKSVTQDPSRTYYMSVDNVCFATKEDAVIHALSLFAMTVEMNFGLKGDETK